jgi:Mak16 protein C-terminal region
VHVAFLSQLTHSIFAFLLQGTYGDIYNFPEAAYTSALASAEDENAEGESEEEDLEGATQGKLLKVDTVDDNSDGEDGEAEEDEQGFPSLAQFVAADDSDGDGGKAQRCVATTLTPFPCALAVTV